MRRLAAFVARLPILAMTGWLLLGGVPTAKATSYLRFENRTQGPIGAPVFDADGVTRLQPPFVAQLWRRVDDTAVEALGESTPFRTGSTAGYLAAVAAVAVNTEPGSVVQLQLRVWDGGLGATYDSAVAAGARSVASPWFNAVTGLRESPGTLSFLEMLTLAGDWKPPVVNLRAVDDTAEGQAGIGSASFEVFLDRAATVPVSVQWRTHDGTATAGQDYNATNGIVAIPAGTDRVPFGVEVRGDTETEDNETVQVEILKVTGGVALAPVLQHLIRNDDPPILVASGSFPVEVTEGRTAVVRLRPSVPHLFGFSLTAVTDGGTADPRNDYLPVHTNLVGEGGIPEDIFVRVVTVSDNEPEPDETVLIRLSDAVGAILPSDPVVPILIRDSGPRPSLSPANIEVTRSLLEETRAEFPIRLSEPSRFPVTVDYATFDESATQPRDYSPATGTIEFAPGETEKAVLVSIPRGGSPSTLTFGIRLSNLRNANLAESSAIATLHSASLPRLLVDDLAIVEPATGTAPVLIPVRITGPLPVALVLEYATRPSTAISGSDYVPSSGRLEIPAGATNTTVRVEISADTEVEATEAFAVVITDSEPNRFGTIIGTITVFDAVTRDNPAAIDPSFDPGAGVGFFAGIPARVETVLLLPDDTILAGGWFNRVQDQPRNLLARLDASGRVDPSFVPGLPSGSFVRALARTSDGALVAGGAFASGNPVLQNLAGLDSSGVLRRGFVAPSANGWVYIALALPDGRVLIGGEFTEVGGLVRPGIARLLPDGTVDPDFQPGTGVTSTSRARIEALALDSSSRLYIGGFFDAYNGTPINGLARLQDNGALDASFLPSGTTITLVSSLLVEPDGNVLASGLMLGGNLNRFLPDGRRDTAFGAPTGTPFPQIADGRIRAVARQADGRILIGGAFQRVQGVRRNRIARLLADGTLDTSFDPGSGADAEVNAIAVQASGGIVVGGAFTNLCGAPRRGVGRLMGSPVDPTAEGPRPVLTVTIEPTHLRVGWSVAPGYVLEGADHSAEPTAWAPVALPVETVGGESRVRIAVEGTGRFFRLRRDR